MIILGIDPGFERLGCAILEKNSVGEELLYSTCLISDRGLPHEKRLHYLGKEIEKIIKKYKPNIAAVEKLFFTKNQKTALQVSEARGMILYVAASKKIPIIEFTPLQIKIALTGYGRAEKRQVQDMTMTILRMKKAPKYDDETDAIAVSLTCSAVNPKITS